jgi:hypothetical protein
LVITTSTATLEELARGCQVEVQTWRLVTEKVVEGFGDGAEVSETKGFELMSSSSASDRCEIEEWEEVKAEDESSEKWCGLALIEENMWALERKMKKDSKVPEAMERFLDGMCVGWEPGEEGKSSMCGEEVVELMCLLADVGSRKR